MGYGIKTAVLFAQRLAKNNSENCDDCKYYFLFNVYLYESNYLRVWFQNVVSVILFSVNVPVLSEQIMFAPPIVSQAYIFLTRFLSNSIFFTEKASDNVTASGSP